MIFQTKIFLLAIFLCCMSWISKASAAVDPEAWKADVVFKLDTLYGPSSPTPDADGLTRILMFLSVTDMQGQMEMKSDYRSPFWRTLQLTMNNPPVFKRYADGLLRDAAKYEEDPSYLRILVHIYEQMSGAPKVSPVIDDMLKEKGQVFGISTAIMKTWESLKATTQKEVLVAVKQLLKMSKFNLQGLDDVVSLVNHVGGTNIMYGITGIHLGYEFYENIRRWWIGEISGERCSKNLIDTSAEVLAGLAGGLKGAAVGTTICPGIGTFVGGAVGGIVSAKAAKYFMEEFTSWIFDIPKEEALEKAYNFMGLHHSASVEAINEACRKKLLLYHPDKGGSPEKFMELRTYFAIIKASKGDLY